MIPAPLLAAFLGIPPSTLRRWQLEGHITRRGTGPNKVALYDAAQVITYAHSIGRTTINPHRARQLATA